MCYTVQEGGGHFGVAEDLRPLPEGQVGGYDQRHLFVKLGHRMEQQLTAVAGERKIPQFVQDQAVVAEHVTDEASAFAGLLFPFEFVHKVDYVVETDPFFLTNQGHAEGEGQMGFPRAGPAHEQDVAVTGYEIAFVQVAHLGFVNGGIGKFEGIQLLD